MTKWIAACIVLSLTTGIAMAQEHGAAHSAAPGAQLEGAAPEGPDNAPHPQLSTDDSWTGTMVGIIALMFVGAMIVGPIVRASTPEEVPPAHSHDEPPGTSGHHGHSGT